MSLLNQAIHTGHWHELIVINDKRAVARAIIANVYWESPQTLHIVTTIVSETGNSFLRLRDEEALEFWHQYTGRRVSWDNRPDLEEELRKSLMGFK